MRLLADENFPYPLVRRLRERGHDVLSVQESLRGLTDLSILARAQVETRLVLTLDKDFGQLAFHFGLPADAGVLLFRLSGHSPARDNDRAIAVIESRDDWAGFFATVTDNHVRMRPLRIR